MPPDKPTETHLQLLNEARRLLQEWIGERVRRPDIRARTAAFIARTKDRDRLPEITQLGSK
jgi:hypothetical protein